MCGRARCALSREAYLHATGLDAGRWQPYLADQYEPRNNIAPGGWLPVIRTTTSPGEGPEVATCKWGLIPSFHKQGDKFDHWLMFNARSETVNTSPVFRRLMSSKRCIVLLNGFYEWKAEAGGRKQPYYIYLKDTGTHDDDKAHGSEISSSSSHPSSPSKAAGKASLASEHPMAVAALWDETKGPDGQPLPTVSILTCDSCSSLTWLHDRMPVILDNKEAAEAWLGAVLPSGWAVHGGTHPIQPAEGKAHKAEQRRAKHSELQHGQMHWGTKHEPKTIKEDGEGHAVTSHGQGHVVTKHEAGQEPIKDEQPAADGVAVQQEQASVQPALAHATTKLEEHKDSVQLEQEQHQVAEQATGQEADDGQAENEEDAQAHTQKGTDPGVVVHQVCHPYSGSNLAWHPVTPQMTNMDYQAADCSMDVRSRRGAITSFFSPKKAAAAAAKNADDCQASGDASSPKKRVKLT